MAEHHFVGVASSAPAVLIGQIAAATNRIQVGSAAVQLGYTTAVAVVESFGMLDAFYPGRIDLGLGGPGSVGPKSTNRRRREQPRPPRAWREVDGVVIPPPFDLRGLLDLERFGPTMEILQQPEAVSPDFVEQIERHSRACWMARYHVRQVRRACCARRRKRADAVGLRQYQGTKRAGCGALGLPFVASYHITPATALEAIEAYRETFVPSASWSQPYVVVSADIVVADDSATATALGFRLRPMGVFNPNRRRRHALSRPRPIARR